MDSREDKLLALVGLLAAGLITVTVLFTLTWLSDLRPAAEPKIDAKTCQFPDNPPL